MKGQKRLFVQHIQEPLAPLPEHLRELYEQECKGEDSAAAEGNSLVAA